MSPSSTWRSTAPNFPGVAAADLRGRLVIARSIDHVEAFNPAKYGAFSSDPVMEITLPSLGDPSLAPAGGCTLSALVEFAPYALADGWETGKPAFQKIVLETLESYAPGLGVSIVATSLMTPLDIEARYNLPGDIGIMANCRPISCLSTARSTQRPATRRRFGVFISPAPARIQAAAFPACPACSPPGRSYRRNVHDDASHSLAPRPAGPYPDAPSRNAVSSTPYRTQRDQ